MGTKQCCEQSKQKILVCIPLIHYIHQHKLYDFTSASEALTLFVQTRLRRQTNVCRLQTYQRSGCMTNWSAVSLQSAHVGLVSQYSPYKKLLQII